MPPDDLDDQVSFRHILAQISKANATRKGDGSVSLNFPFNSDSVTSLDSTVLPDDIVYSKMAESAADHSRELREASEAAKLDLEKQLEARPAKPKSFAECTGTLWYNTWNWTSQPFTPDNEMWYLRPQQLNLWEEKRILAPERTFPTGPCGTARAEFHDAKRQGLPHWKPGGGKHRGERCFADPPPLRSARASSARGPRQSARARPGSSRSARATTPLSWR